jgi:hypothetical protein
MGGERAWSRSTTSKRGDPVCVAAGRVVIERCSAGSIIRTSGLRQIGLPISR